jgi:hypothetical protein
MHVIITYRRASICLKWYINSKTKGVSMPYISSEEVRAIRDKIKQAFPDFKFSVTKRHHSSIDVRIKSGPIDFGESKGYSIPDFRVKEEFPENEDAQILFNDIYQIIKGEKEQRTIVVDGDYGAVPNFYMDVSVDRDYKTQHKNLIKNLKVGGLRGLLKLIKNKEIESPRLVNILNISKEEGKEEIENKVTETLEETYGCEEFFRCEECGEIHEIGDMRRNGLDNDFCPSCGAVDSAKTVYVFGVSGIVFDEKTYFLDSNN